MIDLNKSIVNIEKMLRRLIGEDIELITKLNPSLGRVKADPGQIEQVLMNLSVNARDAMSQGGKLIIETNNVEMDDNFAPGQPGTQTGSYVHAPSVDTGCGMDERRSPTYSSRSLPPRHREREQVWVLQRSMGLSHRAAATFGSTAKLAKAQLS